MIVLVTKGQNLLFCVLSCFKFCFVFNYCTNFKSNEAINRVVFCCKKAEERNIKDSLNNRRVLRIVSLFPPPKYLSNTNRNFIVLITSSKLFFDFPLGRPIRFRYLTELIPQTFPILFCYGTLRFQCLPL